MENKRRDLLLKELCSRLPYGVKVKYKDYWTNKYRDGLVTGYRVDEIDVEILIDYATSPIFMEDVKLYLFPLSSMTDEQWREIEFLAFSKRYSEIVDIYNRNHIDYRGLIEMGLADDATNLNIY